MRQISAPTPEALEAFLRSHSDVREADIRCEAQAERKAEAVRLGNAARIEDEAERPERARELRKQAEAVLAEWNALGEAIARDYPGRPVFQFASEGFAIAQALREHANNPRMAETFARLHSERFLACYYAAQHGAPRTEAERSDYSRKAEALRADSIKYAALAQEAEREAVQLGSAARFDSENEKEAEAVTMRKASRTTEAEALALEALAKLPIPPAPSKRAKIVRAVDVESHGVDNSQYFQGAGVAFTDFDDCATGVGNSEREALADALESLAQSGEWEFRPELGFPPEPSEEDYSDTDSVSEVLAEYAPRIPAPLFEIVRLPPDGSGPYSLLAPTDSLAQAFEHLRVRLAAFARSGYTIENVSERSEPAIRPDSDPDTLEFNSDGDVRAFELQSPEDGSGGDYLLLRLANLREREDFARELERYEENSELYYYVTVRVAQAPEGSERSDGLTEYEDSEGREWAYAPDFETASSAAEAQARESAWAFRLEFLAPFLPENVREPRILEALAKAQEKLSESFGPILEALLGDKLADAMREAVRADGMGAFLAHFDGETVSDSDGAQRFRLN